MIEVNGLVKSFDGFRALDEIDLHVNRGSIYGLVGPNGAGKSTLLRHVAGIYRQDRGSITIGGEPVFENNAVKERMVFIPDDLYFFPQANVEEMREFYQGIYPRFDGKRFESLREVFQIDSKKAIRRFSKGMQKQVAFWLAISCQPEIVLLDEPVDGLDPVMRRQVWGILMGDVAEHETTVLVSSHNLRELEDVCDSVGVLHGGKMLLERSLESMQGSIIKLQIVFGEDEELRLPVDTEVLSRTQMGRIHTLIVRLTAEEARERFETLNPVFMELLPMTLEEIFIYELGGVDYEVKKIVL